MHMAPQSFTHRLPLAFMLRTSLAPIVHLFPCSRVFDRSQDTTTRPVYNRGSTFVDLQEDTNMLSVGHMSDGFEALIS